MNINELSIGDWVCAKLAKWESDDADMTHPLQVKAIYGIERHNLYVDLFNPTNNTIEHSDFAEDLIPIPLTPEILKKNGFTREEDGIGYEWWVLYEEEKEIFTVGFGVAKTEVGKTSLGWTYHTKGDVDYPRAIGLHEFQQALRLAGIEKEIKL